MLNRPSTLLADKFKSTDLTQSKNCVPISLEIIISINIHITPNLYRDSRDHGIEV